MTQIWVRSIRCLMRYVCPFISLRFLLNGSWICTKMLNWAPNFDFKKMELKLSIIENYIWRIYQDSKIGTITTFLKDIWSKASRHELEQAEIDKCRCVRMALRIKPCGKKR